MNLDPSKPLDERPQPGSGLSGHEGSLAGDASHTDAATPATASTPTDAATRGRSSGLPGSAEQPTSAYQQAQAFLYDRINYERISGSNVRYPFRLHRMRELLRRLGLGDYLHPTGSHKQSSPPRKPPRPPVPLVHLAGTKGKGSTAAMVAAMLTANGYRTGLYTSPHLNRLEERFQIDGQACSEGELVTLVERIRTVTTAMTQEDLGEASFFELTTAVAMLHFHERRCDALVLEVGLGGRLDSTNVCLPTVTAITSIGLDHQHVLGNTLGKIAAEKAGIIKPSISIINGVRVASAGGKSIAESDDPARVIQDIAANRDAPLQQIGRDFDFAARPDPDWGSQLDVHFDVGKPSSLNATLGIEGKHQAHNAAIALAIARSLDRNDVPLKFDRCASALASFQCPARVERFVLPRGVIGILDASHNEDSVAALCEILKRKFAGRKVVIVFGTSRDKSAATMLNQLAKQANRLLLTRFHGNPRYVEPAQLLSNVPEAYQHRCELQQDPVRACELGLQQVSPGGVLVVCGSFFTAAETRPWMQRVQQTPQSAPQRPSC